MHAAVITTPGDPDVFAIQELDDPPFGAEEVRVEVRATALNRADLLQRRGRYPGPKGTRDDIPGLEMAGVVEAVGERVAGWQPGDRVMALLAGGGYASKVVVHERMLMPVPDNLDFEQAASIPEVFLTAYDALFRQCGLAMGESVLVHAAGSGVGTAAVQLAHAASCRVFGTAGSAEKLAAAKALGLDVGINYHEEDFAAVVARDTGGAGVHVVLDVIGAPYWEQNLSALGQQGRMILVGTMGGAKLEVNLGALMGKRLQVHGTLLRARPLEQKAQLTQEFIARVLPLFSAGVVRPVVDRAFDLDAVADAHRAMEANENFGKIVLRMP